MNEQQKEVPSTLVDVEKLVTRLEALQAKETALALRETGVATQITDAHVEGLDEKALSTLMWEKRDVGNEREEVSAAIPLLKAKIGDLREAACITDATKRMRGIGKAFGSLLSEIEEDEIRVQEKASAYAAEVTRLTNRYDALMGLRLEANALSDRFGVGAPTFLPVVLPAQREGCKQAAVIVDGAAFIHSHHHRTPKTEKCEHGLRVRRTFGEINGTPAGLIIESAGPKPFPALTEKQKEIVAGQEREKVRDTLNAEKMRDEVERHPAQPPRTFQPGGAAEAIPTPDPQAEARVG